MKIVQLKGAAGDAGGHFRETVSYDAPSDFEMLGVSHYYRISLLCIVGMAHSSRSDIRAALDRMVDDLPPGAIPDALASLDGRGDPRAFLRVRRSVWQQAFRVLSGAMDRLQGKEEQSEK